MKGTITTNEVIPDASVSQDLPSAGSCIPFDMLELRDTCSSIVSMIVDIYWRCNNEVKPHFGDKDLLIETDNMLLILQNKIEYLRKLSGIVDGFVIGDRK